MSGLLFGYVVVGQATEQQHAEGLGAYGPSAACALRLRQRRSGCARMALFPCMSTVCLP